MAKSTATGFRSRLGKRLREMRVAARISSQEELAERAGVHRTYVGRLERGESGVTVETLATVLAALDKSLAEFFESFTKREQLETPRQRQR